MPGITEKLKNLRPFGRRREVEEDDRGDALDETSLAGGGHAGRHTAIEEQLRVSHAIRAYIAHKGILRSSDAGIDEPDIENKSPALHELVVRQHANVPAELTSRAHPLSHYFVSSSHNTYLLAHQLFGTSAAGAYESTLKAGARCVEIDAWDNKEDPAEPKVTHGFTLVSNVPFRAVCEVIRDVIDAEAKAGGEEGVAAAPILLSLENHCGAAGQMRLVEIMTEVLGPRLLSEAVVSRGHEEGQGGPPVKLEELGSKVVVIVEYHFNNAPDVESDSSSESSSDEDDAAEAGAGKAPKQTSAEAAAAAVIIPELAKLGMYAQSVKPPDNSWFAEETGLRNGPHNHLINVSESGLGKHMPTHLLAIAKHNAQHLMRVYPKGTRIGSQNLSPVPFWGLGAQICALNWQTFGASMQLNEALFTGTDGYVLKPAYLRGGERAPDRKRKLRLHVVGATDVPLNAGRDGDDEIKPYVSCVLVHPADLSGKPPKRKTSKYSPRKLDFTSVEPTVYDPVWDEVLEWEYDDDELVFLRILVKSDDRFARNPILATSCVRLSYASKDWEFIRLLDLRGRETRCSLFVKMEITDVE